MYAMLFFSQLFSGFSDGLREMARFFIPEGIAVDKNGIIIVADTKNHCIRHIEPNGNVTTLIGKPKSPGHVNGPKANARLDTPVGVAIHPVTGDIFVTEKTNHDIRVVRDSTLVGWGINDFTTRNGSHSSRNAVAVTTTVVTSANTNQDTNSGSSNSNRTVVKNELEDLNQPPKKQVRIGS